MKKHRFLAIIVTAITLVSLASCGSSGSSYSQSSPAMSEYASKKADDLINETIDEINKDLPEELKLTKPVTTNQVEESSVSETDKTLPLAIKDNYEHTDSSVTIFWNEVEEISKYEIQIKKGGTWQYKGTSRTPEYCIKYLEPETEYEIRIIAKYGLFDKRENITGESSFVKTDAKVIAEIPSLIISGNYEHTDSSVTIFWNEIEDISKYEVQVKKGDTWNYIDTTREPKYCIDRLNYDTEYEVRVIAKYGFFDDRENITSNPINVKTDDILPENKIQVIMKKDYNSTDNAVKIFWEEIEADPYTIVYKIEIKKDDKWAYKDKIYGTDYRISNLKPDTEYIFRVTAQFPEEDRRKGIPSEPLITKTKPYRYEGKELITYYYCEGTEETYHLDKNCSLAHRENPSDVYTAHSYSLPKNKKPCRLCAGGTSTVTTTKTQTTKPPVTSWEPTQYTGLIIINKSTGVYHFPGCRDIDKIAPENYGECYGIPEGYRACGHCS